MHSDDINRLNKIKDRLSPEDGKYICKIFYRDPLKDIYSILLISYIFILGVFLLWPFDFNSSADNDARWIEKSSGIEFLKIGQAVSKSSTEAFYDRLLKGRGLTLEVWLKTVDRYQTGPARILSYSINPVLRNFAVDQSGDKLVVRLRTTKTSLNGTDPKLIIADMFNFKGLQHVVVTYNFSEQRVYINGVQKARSDTLKGNFSNWDRSCKLVIGNEVTGNRPWKGKIYYVAIYDKPLTEREIRQNYFSGQRHKSNTFSPVMWRRGSTSYIEHKANGLVTRYLFDEEKGVVIHDSGSVSNPVNLFMPEYIKLKSEPFLNASISYLHDTSTFSDITLNILIFIPLGILIHGGLRSRFGLTIKISLMTLIVGTLFSLGIESAQYFLMTRHSSLIDVFTNMTGVAMGIVMDRLYYLFLNLQAKRLEMLLYDRKE